MIPRRKPQLPVFYRGAYRGTGTAWPATHAKPGLCSTSRHRDRIGTSSHGTRPESLRRRQPASRVRRARPTHQRQPARAIGASNCPGCLRRSDTDHNFAYSDFDHRWVWMITHQRTPTKPAATAPQSTMLARGGLLQRQCVCGSDAGPSGVCDECKSKKRHLQRKVENRGHSTASQPSLLQRRLDIGACNSPLEQEADRIARQVLSPPADILGSAPLEIQRFTGQPKRQPVTTPDSVDRIMSSPGSPLGSELQQEMSQRASVTTSRVYACILETQLKGRQVKCMRTLIPLGTTLCLVQGNSHHSRTREDGCLLMN